MSAQRPLERDRAAMDRAESLRKTGVNSTATLQDAPSALAASQSGMAKIQAVLDQKAIEAPVRRHDRHPARRCRAIRAARHDDRHAAAARHNARRLHCARAGGRPDRNGTDGDVRPDRGQIRLRRPDRRHRSEDRSADAADLGPGRGEELRRKTSPRPVRAGACRASGRQGRHRAAADGRGDKPLWRLRLRRRAGRCARFDRAG